MVHVKHLIPPAILFLACPPQGFGVSRHPQVFVALPPLENGSGPISAPPGPTIIFFNDRDGGGAERVTRVNSAIGSTISRAYDGGELSLIHI